VNGGRLFFLFALFFTIRLPLYYSPKAQESEPTDALLEIRVLISLLSFIDSTLQHIFVRVRIAYFNHVTEYPRMIPQCVI
jgi:hypothetical protein